MIRSYHFLLLALLCGVLAFAVKVRDAQITADLSALQAHVALLHSELENTNTEMTDQFGILGGKVHDMDSQVGWLEYELAQIKKHTHAVDARRPVPAFPRDSQLVAP